MDHLDRVFRQLLHVVRTRHPQYVEGSFDVAELHQSILPYRHYRRELGLESNDAYEAVLIQMLAGVGGYLIVSDRMRDTLTRELRSTSPDAGAFRQFADELIALSPEAVRRVDGTEPHPGGISSTGVAHGRARGSTGPLCRYCDHGLPVDRAVTFCPHCGQNLALIMCPACNAELEATWKFCTVCGRPTGVQEN